MPGAGSKVSRSARSIWWGEGVVEKVAERESEGLAERSGRVDGVESKVCRSAQVQAESKLLPGVGRIMVYIWLRRVSRRIGLGQPLSIHETESTSSPPKKPKVFPPVTQVYIPSWSQPGPAAHLLSSGPKKCPEWSLAVSSARTEGSRTLPGRGPDYRCTRVAREIITYWLDTTDEHRERGRPSKPRIVGLLSKSPGSQQLPLGRARPPIESPLQQAACHLTACASVRPVWTRPQ